MTAAYNCDLQGVIVIGVSKAHGLIVRSSLDFQTTHNFVSTVLHTYNQRRYGQVARRECGKAWDDAILGGFYDQPEVRE